MADTSWQERLSLFFWILLDGLERFFTENKLLKLVSLAIAFFMWSSISTEEGKTRTLENVPLTVVNRRTETVLTNLPVKVINVKVRGPIGLIDNLTLEDIDLQVDISEEEPGNRWVSPEPVNLPARVEVLEIDPLIIPVNIEARVTQAVPVSPEIDNSGLSSGVVVLDAVVSPATVDLTGPASKVRGIKTVMTNPIKLTRSDSPLTLTTTVLPPGQHLTVHPSQVTVTITFDRLGEKQLTDLRPRLPDRTHYGTVQTVNINLKGPHSLLNKIKADDILVRLDVANLSSGEHLVAPRVELPEALRDRIEVTSIEPEQISVRIR